MEVLRAAVAAAALPVNMLEVQVPGPTLDLLNWKSWGWAPVIAL